MLYWRIQTEDGRTGYQVMNDDKTGAVVVDDNNVPITGNYVYTVVDMAPALPAWANA